MSDHEKTTPSVTSPDLPHPETDVDAQSGNPLPSLQRASETLSPTSKAITESTVSPKTDGSTGLWSRRETQPANESAVPTTNFGLWQLPLGESGNTRTHPFQPSTASTAGGPVPEPPGQELEPKADGPA